MAPKISDDSARLKFEKQCTCKNHLSVVEKVKNSRPTYGLSVSASDLSYRAGVKNKSATLGSSMPTGLEKTQKSGYRRLLQYWKRLKKTLSSSGSKLEKRLSY